MCQHAPVQSRRTNPASPLASDSAARTLDATTACGSGVAARAAVAPRVVADLCGSEPGPLFLAVGGIHGNEPAGVEALIRVAAHFGAHGGPSRGRFVALVGNQAALRQHVRYLESDLNRMWTEEQLASLERRDPALDGSEEREVRELLATIEAALAEHDPTDGPAVVIDLHTSSAPGEPFLCMGDTLQNRRIAHVLPIPVILGLEENIDGALLEYFSSRGHVSLAIEGGQHDAEDTPDRLEAALWLALVGAGVVTREDAPRLDEHRQLLAEVCRGLDRYVEVRHRHGTADGDGFAMEPGWRNFHPVERGRVVAHDGTGEIRAELPGLMLLPRYQGQGNDGFFLARRVRYVWLALSAWLRRLGLEPLLMTLPGVSRHPEITESLRVDRKVARWWAVELFHLFGYRRRRSEGDRLVFTRRSEGP